MYLRFELAYSRLIKALTLFNIDSTKLVNDRAEYTRLDLVHFSDKQYTESNKAISELLCTKLASQFHPSTFEMVDAMFCEYNDSQYYLLTSDNEQLNRIADWPMYAKSVESGLASVKDMIFEKRLIPDDIIVKNKVITIIANGKSLVTLSPLQINQSYESGRAQAESCFKNLQTKDISTTAFNRIKKLPGMTALNFAHPPSPYHKDDLGYALLPSIKNSVHIIHKFLKHDAHISVSLSIAQEITAYFLSGHTWQVLIAASKKSENKLTLPPVMVRDAIEGNEKISIFRNYGDALWHFCKLVESKHYIPDLLKGFRTYGCEFAVFNNHTDFELLLNLTELSDYINTPEAIDEFVGTINDDDYITTKHLRELFYIDLKFENKIKKINALSGPPEFLKIKNWMFSFSHVHERPLLRIEKVNDDGMPINNEIYYTYIYKAQLNKSGNLPSSIWILLGDYRKEVVLEFPEDFNDEDAFQLNKFSKVAINHFEINP